MTRNIIIGIFIILIVCGNAAAWLSGYDYRMPIELNNTGNNLTYYQYNFTTNTQSLVSAGKMQANGSDCRITNDTDVLQEFWNATAFNLSNTKIWVNATEIGNITNTTHYLYYGNSGASSVMDGGETFIHFDDFETYNTTYSASVSTGSGIGVTGGLPRIVVADNGTWIMARRPNSGTHAGQVYMANSTDNGSTWNDMGDISQNTSYDIINADFIKYPNGDIECWATLYWNSNSTWPDNCTVISRSTDNGATWSAFTHNSTLLSDSALWSAVMWQTEIIDGVTYMMTYFDAYGYFFNSTDNGSSWTRISHFGGDVYEPGFAYLGNNTFISVCRDPGNVDTKQYRSTDMGETWSLDGYLKSDGSIAMSGGTDISLHQCRMKTEDYEGNSLPYVMMFGAQYPSGYPRTPKMYFSVDDGESWTTGDTVGETRSGTDSEFMPMNATDAQFYQSTASPTEIRNDAVTVSSSDVPLTGLWNEYNTDVYINTSVVFGGGHSARYSGSGSLGCSLSTSDKISINYMAYKTTTSSSEVYIGLHGDATHSIYAAIAGTNSDIKYHDGAWHDTGHDFALTQWKSVELRDFNWSSHTFDILYDGAVIANNVGMRTTSSYTDAMRIFSSPAVGWFVDNIYVRKWVTLSPIASLGAEEGAPISDPIITLLSQAPSTLYQNSTGYMNISYGITHDSSGLNNTSVSFIFRNYDHTLNDANHSIRPPANDKCEMWNFDGKIMRAANRNETLNFEKNATITGGDLFTWSGLDENNTRLTIAPVNSTYTIVHINGTIHDLAMEQMWYLDRTDMVESPKTKLSIHKTQDVLIKFWNAEIFKGNYDFIGIGYTDTSLNSAPALQPSDATPVSFYYLNSSYDPLGGVDPLDSGYAVFMGSLNATQWVDHVYSPDQNASYVRGAINNTLLNSVIDTTEISYLYFKSETPSSKPFYINITDASTNTNRTFGQTDVLWIGDAAPYTAHPYTPNVWFAFVYESTSFDHKLYVADNNDKWGNSTLQTTDIGAGLFPPTVPTIHHFNFNGSVDYDKNKTYSGTIDVGIGVGTDPDGGTVTHNLTLHYANKTFIAIINNTFTDAGIIGNGVYSNISFNTTPYYSETEKYTLKVVATDDEGETSESWSCCNFTLGTHKISNLHTTTLVYDRIVWGWTNPDHYDTIMVYLDNIWKQNTTGTSYSASGLSQTTTYTIKLITVYAGEESDPVTDTQVTPAESGGSGGGGGTPTPTPTATATPTPITPLPDETVTENVSIAIEPIPEITEEITSNYTVIGSIWHLTFDKHSVFIPEYSNIIACDAIPPYACRYYEDQKKFEIVIDGESPEPVFNADQWVSFITRDGKRISQRISTKVYNPLFYFTMPAISGSVGDFSRYFVHGTEFMVDGVRFWWLGLLGAGFIAWRWKRRNV